ncbi:hypothetical protein Syn7502_02827 [Synechococcus sp. PCC 7502]|nr:hypothetical protein [Synechococcus sp. PCC 7502]AFY74764.1 hypothetical protein Syn7502_02827 [Synechococcus sp. PCC 7502]
MQIIDEFEIEIEDLESLKLNDEEKEAFLKEEENEFMDDYLRYGNQ